MDSLNAKNIEALNELNRQIDQLASLPLRNLPEYDDSVLSFDTRDRNLTFDNNFLTQDTDALFARAEAETAESTPKRGLLSVSPPKKISFDDHGHLYKTTGSVIFDHLDILASKNLADKNMNSSINSNSASFNASLNYPKLTSNNESFHLNESIHSNNSTFIPNFNSSGILNLSFNPTGANPTLQDMTQNLEKHSPVKAQSTRSDASSKVNHPNVVRYNPWESFDDQQLLFDHQNLASDSFSEFKNLASDPTIPEFKKTASGTFILDNDPHRSVKSIPSDVNSRAVVNALRTLQERVGKLEGDKVIAKEKISELEKELSATRKLLFQQQAASQPKAPLDLNLEFSSLNLKQEKLDEAVKGEILDDSLKSILQPITSKPYQSTQPAPINTPELKESPANAENIKISEATLEHIASAREKVLKLKERFSNPTKEQVLSQSLQAVESAQPKNSQLKTFISAPKSQDSPERHAHVIVRTSSNYSHTQSDLKQSDSQALNRKPVEAWSQVPLSDQGHEAKSPARPNNDHENTKSPARFNDDHDILKKSTSSPARPQEDYDYIKRSPARLYEEHNNIKKSEILQSEIELERAKRQKNETLLKEKQAVKEALLEKLQKANSKPVNEKTASGPKWETFGKKKKVKKSTAHLPKRKLPEVPTLEGIPDTSTGREMPFVVGANPGKSFSVTANLQKVYSMLKNHNPDLCTTCCKGNETKQKLKPPEAEKPKTAKSSKDLYNVLYELEDEFNLLKSKYHQLVISYEKEPRREAGEELRLVIQNMDSKGDQISILRDIISTAIVKEQAPPEAPKNKPKRYQLETQTSKSKQRAISTKTLSTVQSLDLLKSTIKVQNVLS